MQRSVRHRVGPIGAAATPLNELPSPTKNRAAQDASSFCFLLAVVAVFLCGAAAGVVPTLMWIGVLPSVNLWPGGVPAVAHVPRVWEQPPSVTAVIVATRGEAVSAAVATACSTAVVSQVFVLASGLRVVEPGACGDRLAVVRVDDGGLTWEALALLASNPVVVVQFSGVVVPPPTYTAALEAATRDPAVLHGSGAGSTGQAPVLLGDVVVAHRRHLAAAAKARAPSVHPDDGRALLSLHVLLHAGRPHVVHTDWPMGKGLPLSTAELLELAAAVGMDDADVEALLGDPSTADGGP